MGKTARRTEMINFNELGADMTYVINLKSATIRRRELKTHLNSNFKNIHYTGKNKNIQFIEAIDGSKMKPDTECRQMIKDRILSNSFVDMGGLLTCNIIACSLSHKKALETFLESDNETALILEDDVRLSADFYREYTKGVFTKFVKEAFEVPNWEVIYYSKQWDWIPPKRQYSDHAYEPKKHLPNYANAAYVVNRKSAQKLLRKWLPIGMAADTYVESHHDVGVAHIHSWFNQYRGGLPPSISSAVHLAIMDIRMPGAPESIKESEEFVTSTGKAVHNDNSNKSFDNVHEASHGEEDYRKTVRHITIPESIPVQKVTFEDVKFPDGHIGYNWSRIWLQQ